MRYIISKRVKSTNASWSSNDTQLYKFVEKAEFDKFKSQENVTSKGNVGFPPFGFPPFSAKFAIDETHEPDGWTRGVADSKVYKDYIKAHTDNGWVTECKILYDYYDYKEKRKAERKRKAGYVNYKFETNRKDPMNFYIGGLSKAVKANTQFRRYVSGVPFGYIGHSVRTVRMDAYLEQKFRKICDDTEIFVEWVCSRPARHTADQWEGTGFKNQKKKIDATIESIVETAKSLRTVE